MSTLSKPTLFHQFSSAFYEQLAVGRLDSVAIVDWLKVNHKQLTITPSELYRLARELHRYASPRFPVRYWFYQSYLACGYQKLRNRERFDEWVSHQPILSPLFGKAFTTLATTEFDLSEQSGRATYAGTHDQLEEFEGEIASMLHDEKAKIGYGGYTEIRNFYRLESAGDFPWEQQPVRQRKMHLGMDFWTEAGTPVYTPLDGIVYGFSNNRGVRDLGPVVILFHRPEPSVHFYTFYSHLDPTAIRNLRHGKFMRAGSKLGVIGSPEVNGHWPPHLHFQLCLDMMGQRDRFFGVGFAEEKKLWTSLCPDPALLLR